MVVEYKEGGSFAVTDDSKVENQTLDLTTSEAVAWSAAHPGWWIFPGRMVRDSDGGWIKRPLVLWTKSATKDPEEVRRLWDKVGGRAVVCVACEPTGIFVIDEDRDVTDPTWKSVLNLVVTGKLTLVLKSCTKGRPHYIFKQPATGDPVAEGRWESGDVKSTGMIMISKHDPIVDAPPAAPPAGLLALLKRRPKGAKGRGLASYEALNDWLGDTPDMMVLGESAQEKFLERVIDRMVTKVEDGAHRRQAALETVYQAALEASAGCYSAQTAYTEIKEAYQELREGDPNPAKGWNVDRALDYDYMWASLVPEFRAGDHDEKIQEIQDDLFERGFDDEDDDFEDLGDWMKKILNATVRRDLAEEPVAIPPVPGISTPIESEVLVEEETPPGPGEPEESPVSTPTVDTEDGDSNNELALSLPGVSEEVSSQSEAEVEFTPPPPVTSTPAAPPVRPRRQKSASGGLVGIGALKLRLPEEALWGPHGEFIEAALPYTEVDEAGLLACCLASAGVYHGLAAHFALGGAVHGPNVFVMCIGESASSRKSTAWKTAEAVYFPKGITTAVPTWSKPQKFGGIASGEQLVHQWDPIPTIDEDGMTSYEAPEPRGLWIEAETSSLIKRVRREGSVMGEMVCQLWDQGDLEHRARTATLSLSAEQYRAGYIGLSTISTISGTLTSLEAASGFGNRFLWFYLPDTGEDRDQSEGGNIPDHVIETYQRALRLDKVSMDRVPVDFTDEARDLWKVTYSTLKREKGDGLLQEMLNRAEPYVKRLALNYHLSARGAVVAKDGSNKVVGVKSLEAALAVWDYVRASTSHIFAATSGDPEIDELVLILKDCDSPVMQRAGIRVYARSGVNTVIERAQRRKIIKTGKAYRSLGGRGGRPASVLALTDRVDGDGKYRVADLKEDGKSTEKVVEWNKT